MHETADSPTTPGWRPIIARWGVRPRRRLIQRLVDRRGATMLEWTLLLAAIALPSYAIVLLLLETLTAHFGIVLVWTSLPLP